MTSILRFISGGPVHVYTVDTKFKPAAESGGWQGDQDTREDRRVTSADVDGNIQTESRSLEHMEE